jgi:hypothetical protein
MARTTPPFRIGLVGVVLATAVGWAHASQSIAASDLTVNVPGPTPGMPATTGPVVVGVHTTVAVDQSGAPQLRALGLRMPPGFSTAVAGIPPCDANAIATPACAASKLGTGKASVRVFPVNLTATTQELSIFRSTGNNILAYVRIKGRSAVLPGTLDWRVPDAPLLKLDLRKILQFEGMSVAVTSADITLTQGLQAGPCPTGSWTFKAQLDFVGAAPVVKTPSAPCAQSPAPAPPAPVAPPAPAAPAAPVLRAFAAKSTRVSGAHVAIFLSAPAKVKITLERRVPKRWIAMRRLSVQKRGGWTSLAIHTAHGHRLPAGRYRCLLQAVDAAGAVSAPKTVRFTLR